MERAIVLLAVVSAAFGTAVSAAAPTLASTPPTVMIHILRTDTDTWSSTGAFSDAGPFVDVGGVPAFFAGRSSTFHVVRTFTGADGTFDARVDVRITPTDDPDVLAVEGRWAVLSGTDGYQDLHGAGAAHESFDLTTGVIEGDWTGLVQGV